MLLRVNDVGHMKPKNLSYSPYGEIGGGRLALEKEDREKENDIN